MLHVAFDDLSLEELAGDELLPPEVRSHVAACADCRAELVARREAMAAVSAAGRELSRMPVNTARGWSAVRRRLGEPIVMRVQRASRRLSLQAALSGAIVAMAFLSGVTLNLAQATGPSVPAIQTPAAVLLISDDTPTLAVTRANAGFTPTLTITPVQVVTN